MSANRMAKKEIAQMIEPLDFGESSHNCNMKVARIVVHARTKETTKLMH